MSPTLCSLASLMCLERETGDVVKNDLRNWRQVDKTRIVLC